MDDSGVSLSYRKLRMDPACHEMQPGRLRFRSVELVALNVIEINCTSESLATACLTKQTELHESQCQLRNQVSSSAEVLPSGAA